MLLDSIPEESEKKIFFRNKYRCGWCDMEFTRDVMRTPFNRGKDGHGKSRACSDNVRCPKCGNFIKVWV